MYNEDNPLVEGRGQRLLNTLFMMLSLGVVPYWEQTAQKQESEKYNNFTEPRHDLQVCKSRSH